MNDKAPLALDFKSATLYTVRVVLHDHDTDQLEHALRQRMKDAGSFFKDEAVVIDASGVTKTIDWQALTTLLREQQLHPIGVVATDANLQAAQQAGLTSVELSAPATRPSSTPADDKDVPAVTPPRSVADASKLTAAQNAATGQQNGGANATTSAAAGDTSTPAIPQVAPAALVINRPLRSGQRIYARDTDLIVIGMVSQGAEVIADGNIHVYGPLRGKAMAGARGDATARIFTTQLDPELVAIAGVYRVIETRLDDHLLNQPTLIQRDGDTLQINALGK